MKRHARCGVCFRLQLIKRDGHLFKHRRGYGPNPSDQPMCEGSGRKVER